ncbi:hypothetical protein EIN_155280 [Entamoeba invadens IP1]|uniref:TLDc domain-containing protein n=1 Tax=Entamoeba invadens IP1 TaxID=370355 RepID=A0A0A1UF47_ENTIV|nr:hypothetical protein EIN_155280 [Entamoeba invadens IP1]ELP91421.1 hypothetical protein EIN_155280 [Entamoeba invadens IP1]|eukprot:XP_004258192.1 hypothetical protein EIN_155280 [Entamoeba invadens IP1]
MKNILNEISTYCQQSQRVLDEFETNKIVTQFKDNKTLNISERIKNAEKYYDQVEEMYKRKKEMEQTLQPLQQQMDVFIKALKKEMGLLSNETNKTTTLIRETLVALYDEEFKLLRAPFDLEIKKLEDAKNRKMQSLNTLSDKLKERVATDLSVNELIGLENITSMQINEIVFDSNVDDWGQDTSVFLDKISNKENLCFLVEDDKDNKFGGVIIDKIPQRMGIIVGQSSYIYSLTRNGVVTANKYEKKSDAEYSYYLGAKKEDCLIGFGNGHDIHVHKKNSSGSHFIPNTYPITYTDFSDTKDFNQTRVRVFQLI